METTLVPTAPDIAVEVSSGGLVLRLPKTLGTELAVPLYGAAVQLLLGAGDAVVDCKATRTIGAAALQILIALARELDRAGRRLVLSSVDAELAAALERLGAGRLLHRRG